MLTRLVDHLIGDEPRYLACAEDALDDSRLARQRARIEPARAEAARLSERAQELARQLREYEALAFDPPADADWAAIAAAEVAVKHLRRHVAVAKDLAGQADREAELTEMAWRNMWHE